MHILNTEDAFSLKGSKIILIFFKAPLDRCQKLFLNDGGVKGNARDDGGFIQPKTEYAAGR